MCVIYKGRIMTIRTLSVASVASLLALVLSTSPALAKDDPKIAAEIIAITKAQWAAEMASKSVADQLASADDDYTEINGNFPVRIDGKALNVRFNEASMKDGEKTLAADMANAKVQVYGDTAILSYNYVGVAQTKDGKTKSRFGKSTRVYAKLGTSWKLVHAHFSPVTGAKD